MLPPKPKRSRWPAPIWAGLSLTALVAVIGTALWGDFSSDVPTSLSAPPVTESSAAIKNNTVEMVDVIIARENLATGTVLAPELITTISFPKELLPTEAISATESVLGKVVLGPIPSFAVLSKLQIGSPVAVIGDSADLGNPPERDLLAALKNKLVEVRIATKAGGISPGTPIQISAQSARGKELINISEGWTVSSDERGANVLVSPGAAKQIATLQSNAVWKITPLR